MAQDRNSIAKGSLFFLFDNFINSLKWEKGFILNLAIEEKLFQKNYIFNYIN